MDKGISSFLLLGKRKSLSLSLLLLSHYFWVEYFKTSLGHPKEEEKNREEQEASNTKQWPTVHVILITPPPIYEPARLLYPYGENNSGLPERTYEAAETYAKACLAVAAELGIPSVDLWTKVQEVPDWQTACLSDGLHLSRAGNAIVFKEVVDVLKKLGSSVETLRVDFPLIDDIDPNDPLKSFENLKN